MSKEGLIIQRKLRQIARSVLDFLEREDIDSTETLEKKLGESFYIKGKDHIIQIELKPSSFGNEDYAITYIIPNGGIPIEIRMNPNFNYSKMGIATTSRLNGYTSFPTVIPDYFGNISRQYKIIEDCSIPEIKRELEKLAS